MIVSESLPLVAYGEIIVVTLNYRLGALGFLSTGKFYSFKHHS